MVGCALAATACVHDVRSVETDVNPVFTPFDKISDECTDEKLALWFDLFNQFQEEGLEMFEADEKARKQVELELSACNDADHSSI